MDLKWLVNRVRQLLLHPRKTLPATLAESGGLTALLPYVLVLAAIGPFVGFLSSGVIGHYRPSTVIFNTTVPGMYVRAPGLALVTGILQFLVGVGAFYFYARVLGWLAPTFGGRDDRGGALKTSAYASTPIWLAGAFSLLNSIPYLGWIAYMANVAGFVYAVVLGTWSVPLHLGTPAPKAVGHVLASMGITVVAITLTYSLLALILIGTMLR
jgi:hypothetical protein